MSAVLLALFLLIQGIPSRPGEGGAITGVLKDMNGKPAAHVRVGAIPVPDGTADLGSVAAMVSLAETDDNGAYRLDDVPAGRYYVAAGRVDFPTYFPGTNAVARGTAISITSRATVSGIDFTIQDLSARSAAVDLNLTLGVLTFAVPVQVKVEGGGKLPVFSPAGFVALRFTNVATGEPTDLPINASTLNAASQTTRYRVEVQNLPEGYGVKSIMVGGVDIRNSGLNVGALAFQLSGPATSTLLRASMTATAGVDVTLTGRPPVPAASGVRVSGRAKDSARRSIYLSGKAGLFYSDGSFEFFSVAPGRHRIATLDNPESTRRLAAVVAVGQSDVGSVELQESPLLPQDVAEALTPGLARESLRSLTVSMVEEGSHEPTGPGTVYVTGRFGTSFDLPEDGRFQISNLLPGVYNFEIQVFRHTRHVQSVTVADEDVNLELSVRPVD